MKKLITEGPKRTYEQIILDDMNVGCERIINNINDKVESLHKQICLQNKSVLSFG